MIRVLLTRLKSTGTNAAGVGPWEGVLLVRKRDQESPSLEPAQSLYQGLGQRYRLRMLLDPTPEQTATGKGGDVLVTTVVQRHEPGGPPVRLWTASGSEYRLEIIAPASQRTPTDPQTNVPRPVREDETGAIRTCDDQEIAKVGG